MSTTDADADASATADPRGAGTTPAADRQAAPKRDAVLPRTSAKANRSASWTGAGPLRLLQLTDLHLYREADGCLLGQPTRRTLALVLERLRQRHWPPDAILLTGDLVHDESAAGYRYLRGCLDALGVPCHCLPGNHDRPDLMATWLDADSAAGLRRIAYDPWDLILLDSTLPGSDGGHLAVDLLARLQQHLQSHPGRPTLICLHHQPVPMGSRWVDSMMVDNGADLLALAACHPQLRGILWGHVHQAFAAQHGDTLLLATPSTCVQFLPASRDFALDTLPPGYRWLELYPDGRISTGIERIDGYPEPFAAAASGG
ncbi:MAG: phosphoesterase [Chromatiaceae bacterium]|nr:MAG: phosphoesterase [Chromatiaceae bacterium]